jgi:hypothetical protein
MAAQILLNDRKDSVHGSEGENYEAAQCRIIIKSGGRPLDKNHFPFPNIELKLDGAKKKAV